MADMQRAFNSKRSIAEIALTRMCDSKLDGSYEALLDRISALEREVSMLKYSAPRSYQAEQNEVESPVTTPEIKVEKTEKSAEDTSSVSSYSSWHKVVEKIAEIKRPLAAPLNSAAVYCQGNNNFVLQINDFFAKRLSSSEQDMAIIRGVIAETEGVDPMSVSLKVESVEVKTDSAFSDIENAFK